MNFYYSDGHSTVYLEIFKHGHKISVILNFYSLNKDYKLSK